MLIWKQRGLTDIGYLVHCNRHHAMIAGFNPDLEFVRTQRVMEDASHGDFHFGRKAR